MADRVGVIDNGRIILVEDKVRLMAQLGRRQLTLHLQQPLATLPPDLRDFGLEHSADGLELVYRFDARGERAPIAELLRRLDAHGIVFKDLQTAQSSLEDIFVSLVHKP